MRWPRQKNHISMLTSQIRSKINSSRKLRDIFLLELVRIYNKHGYNNKEQEQQQPHHGYNVNGKVLWLLRKK